jgi:hypothetical protein
MAWKVSSSLFKLSTANFTLNLQLNLKVGNNFEAFCNIARIKKIRKKMQD